jgi:Ni/Fe-hydrogenase subunit HybB-like protein
MHTDSIHPATVSGYATGPVTKTPNWHGLVAWDLLFNNLATGLFLVAAVGELAAPPAFAAVAKVAYPTALVFLLIDLLLLVADLGDPLRFHHMLRVFKPSSPMSLGTWCLTVYSLPLTVLAANSLLPGGGAAREWVHWAAVIAGLLPALGSALYKGVLFSTSSQPGWKDARWLGGYLTNSALLLGCAELLALSILMGPPAERAAAILRPSLVLLLLLNVGMLGLLMVDLRAALARAYTSRTISRFGALALGGGAVVPLCLLVVGGPDLLLGAVLFIVLGALVVRLELVRLPHVEGVS